MTPAQKKCVIAMLRARARECDDDIADNERRWPGMLPGENEDLRSEAASMRAAVRALRGVKATKKVKR